MSGKFKVITFKFLALISRGSTIQYFKYRMFALGLLTLDIVLTTGLATALTDSEKIDNESYFADVG